MIVSMTATKLGRQIKLTTQRLIELSNCVERPLNVSLGELQFVHGPCFFNDCDPAMMHHCRTHSSDKK
jgi:hypothetical protein